MPDVAASRTGAVQPARQTHWTAEFFPVLNPGDPVLVPFPIASE